MLINAEPKALPGSKSFFGLKNMWDMSQAGMRDFISACWQEYGDIFEVRVGPKKLVVVIHPEHVRHITITNAQNYEKLESYDGVRKYVIGDGLVTSTGELWKRQRRLMDVLRARRGQLRPVGERGVEAPPFRQQPRRDIGRHREHAGVEVRNGLRARVAGHVRARRQRQRPLARSRPARLA
jgi:hypothetical protein